VQPVYGSKGWEFESLRARLGRVRSTIAAALFDCQSNEFLRLPGVAAGPDRVPRRHRTSVQKALPAFINSDIRRKRRKHYSLCCVEHLRCHDDPFRGGACEHSYPSCPRPSPLFGEFEFPNPMFDVFVIEFGEQKSAYVAQLNLGRHVSRP
jgi:hypothetical protein